MTEKQLSRNRMGSIDTWSFGEGNTSYAERFELAVGCSPARYAEIVDPKALLDLRNDAAGYAAAQRRAREVGECKAELCVLLVLEAIACQVGCTPEALGEQLAGTCTIDVNMNDVARRLDGPLTLGSKTVRPNAGQCLKDLLHRHARVNVGLLSSPDDRGVHTTRRAHATVQVGGRAVCVPQGPTRSGLPRPRAPCISNQTSARPVSEAASSPSAGAPLARERHDRPEAGLLGRVQWVGTRRACMVHTDLVALR